MTGQLESDFARWERAFREDLSKHLAALRAESGLFGFALEPSDDLGNLHFITCVGRESKIRGDSISQRFSHVEWSGFLPQQDFDESLQQLETISKAYHDVLIDSATSTDTEIGATFRKQFYSTLLQAMVECDRRGEFGTIWFKIVSFSDRMDSIQLRSFFRLNCNIAFLSRLASIGGRRFAKTALNIGRRVLNGAMRLFKNRKAE